MPTLTTDALLDSIISLRRCVEENYQRQNEHLALLQEVVFHLRKDLTKLEGTVYYGISALAILAGVVLLHVLLGWGY